MEWNSGVPISAINTVTGRTLGVYVKWTVNGRQWCAIHTNMLFETEIEKKKKRCRERESERECETERESERVGVRERE